MSQQLQFEAGLVSGNARRGSWELVGTYPTMELASAAVSTLALEGVESQIALVDGLSVLARVQDGA